MDWELYERYRATAILLVTALSCSLLLIFHQSRAVQRLKATLVFTTLPIDRSLSQLTTPKGIDPDQSPEAIVSALGFSTQLSAEQNRMLRLLEQENEHLHQLLDLKEHRWPRALAAHVVGRDPHRWFQEILIDRGASDGVSINNAVIGLVGDKEGLIGRVAEVQSHVAKVRLIQDSLSAVAATIIGDASEDGVVEGTDSNDLYLRYLDRGSRIKIGDLVVTSGLGQMFPAGIAVGWVIDIRPDLRQLFLEARLRPALVSDRLRSVLILVPSPNDKVEP